MSEPIQQITAQNFIRLGVAAFKEHELREIVATFCKLPGIAPTVAAKHEPVGTMATVDDPRSAPAGYNKGSERGRRTFDVAATAVTPDTQEQLAEAGRGAIAIRNELDRVRVDLYQAKDEALRWKAQFDSASAAASEYSEFWEQHSGEFDSFGNYIPHSQIDGDLRSAKVRIAELEALVSRPMLCPTENKGK